MNNCNYILYDQSKKVYIKDKKQWKFGNGKDKDLKEFWNFKFKISCKNEKKIDNYLDQLIDWLF